MQCQVQDLQSKGAFYTWNNRQIMDRRVWSRLDRLLVNDHWLATFPDSEYWCLQELISDHTRLVLHMALTKASHQRRFKYCNMWALHPNFQSLVLNAWSTSVERYRMMLYSIVCKLKLVRRALCLLNQENFGDIIHRADTVREQLLLAQQVLHLDPLNAIFDMSGKHSS